MAGKTPQNGSPTAALLLGVSFFAVASYWPYVMGSAGAADDLYTGFFKLVGAIAALGGIGGYYKAWQQYQKRKATEALSGTFGDAAFATLDECRDAGLVNPNGLYLGLLDGEALFYSGKAHLLTCAPARQGKGIGVVIPNLLHYQGSVMPFWFFAPWREWASVNPVEGDFPNVKPLVRLAYTAKKEAKK